jgi:hypothetical protein
VAVAGVFAEADVGDEDEAFGGGGGLESAKALLDDSVVGPCAGAFFIFGFGEAEEEKAAQAEIGRFGGILDGFVDAEIEDAGHGGDFFTDAFAGADEEWKDELAGFEAGFADEAAEGLGTAGSPHADEGKVHL